MAARDGQAPWPGATPLVTRGAEAPWRQAGRLGSYSDPLGSSYSWVPQQEEQEHAQSHCRAGLPPSRPSHWGGRGSGTQNSQTTSWTHMGCLFPTTFLSGHQKLLSLAQCQPNTPGWAGSTPRILLPCSAPLCTLVSLSVCPSVCLSVCLLLSLAFGPHLEVLRRPAGVRD